MGLRPRSLFHAPGCRFIHVCGTRCRQDCAMRVKPKVLGIFGSVTYGGKLYCFIQHQKHEWAYRICIDTQLYGTIVYPYSVIFDLVFSVSHGLYFVFKLYQHVHY